MYLVKNLHHPYNSKYTHNNKSFIMENEYHHNSEQCIKIILIESDTSESPIHGFSAIEPDLRSESDCSVVWCAPSSDEEATDQEQLSPFNDTQSSDTSETNSCNNCKLKAFKPYGDEDIILLENRRRNRAISSISRSTHLEPEHIFVPENTLQDFIKENRNNIDLDYKFPTGHTILSLAYKHNLHGQLYVLLANGANPDIIFDGDNTLLHMAAYDGNRLAIKLLLEYSADPFIKNGMGEIPLNITMAIKHQDATNILFNKMKEFPYYLFKSETNEKRTLFHYSALFNCSLINKYMCEYVFSNASKKDVYGNTAFHYAVIGKHQEITEMYLAWQVTEIRNSNGNHPVHYLRDYNLVKVYLEYNPEQLYKKNKDKEDLEKILSRDDKNLLRLVRQDFQLFASQPTKENKRRRSTKRTWSDSENVSSE